MPLLHVPVIDVSPFRGADPAAKADATTKTARRT